MRTAGRVTTLLGAALAALPLLAACAQPEYRYVGNDDHDVVLRVPADWEHISFREAMRAAGEKDPAAAGWRTYFDGDERAAAAHATAAFTDEPVLMASSIDVPEESREAVTDDVLRDFVLPVTEAVAAQEQVLVSPSAAPSASASPQATPRYAVLADKAVSTSTSRGVHLLFSYTLGGHTEVFDQVAVTDPDRSRIHLALVHCSKQCFTEHRQEIDRVVSSLTVKKT